jgi:hypothetical protein
MALKYLGVTPYGRNRFLQRFSRKQKCFCGQAGFHDPVAVTRPASLELFLDGNLNAKYSCTCEMREPQHPQPCHFLTDMNLEQAMQALEVRKTQLQSRIPAQISILRTRYLKGVIEEEVEAARKHLQAVYLSRLEVGPNLTALDRHLNQPKYTFWMEGIRRHLGECEAILAEQPDGRNDQPPK